MPLYIEKKKLMVTLTDRPTNRQGEYRAICLFRKLENRKKGRDLQYLTGKSEGSSTCYDEKLDPKGEEYKGFANTTESGRACQVTQEVKEMLVCWTGLGGKITSKALRPDRKEVVWGVQLLSQS